MYDQLFSPLGKEWCNYFKYLMYFSFLFVILAVLAVGYDLMQKKRKFGFDSYVLAITQAVLGYFVNRLMYSICVN